MQLFVRTLTGKTISVEIEETDTISKLKQAIQDKEGIPVEHQRIIHVGKQLNNSRILKNFGFKTNVGPTLVIDNPNGHGRGAARSNNRGNVTIFIRLLDGRFFDIQINKSSDTYESLKQKVCKKYPGSIIPSQVKLIYGATEINDDKIQNPRNIVDSSTLTCIINPVSGAALRANNGRGRREVASLSPNLITANKIRNFKELLSDNRRNNIIKSKIIKYAQSKGITNVNKAIEGYTNQELQKQAAAAEMAGGFKRKPTTKKKVRKIHKGPQGGKYYISKGRKVYI